MKFACEVWDPSLVKHQTQLENVQRRAVRFITGLRGVESVTEARKKLALKLLVDRRKAACISLLMKIIGDDRHSSLVDCFDSLSKGCHTHYARSAASNSLCHCIPIKLYFNSLLHLLFI